MVKGKHHKKVEGNEGGITEPSSLRRDALAGPCFSRAITLTLCLLDDVMTRAQEGIFHPNRARPCERSSPSKEVSSDNRMNRNVERLQVARLS